MNIIWTSIQGAQRNANNDYVAVKADEEQLIAVIVDAAERGGNAQRFAEHWATLLLTTYTQPTRLPLNILLRELPKTLVPEFLHERASYSLVDIDLRNNSGEIIYVGDCLLAVVTGSQTYRVNQPHVINHTFTSLGDSYAHILTRVLKANRFMPPERIGFTWQQGDKLLLSTDGYWQWQADGQTGRLSVVTMLVRCTLFLMDQAAILRLKLNIQTFAFIYRKQLIIIMTMTSHACEKIAGRLTLIAP